MDPEDLEKAMEEAMGASHAHAQVPEIAGGGEQDLLVPDLPAEGGIVVAAKMNPAGLKKWRLPYWLVAGSVMALTNHILASPKYEQLLLPGLGLATMSMLAMMILCANCMLLRAK